MSLINCPECGNEVSTEAVACPNCGRPLAAPTPVVQRRVIVAEPRDDGFPKWVIAPIAILGIVVIFLLIAVTRNNEDEANRTVNVNLAAQRRTAESRDATRDASPPNRIEVPSSSTTVNPPAPPPSSAPAASYPSSTTSVPPSSAQTVPVDKASVVIDAKVATGAGAIQSVKNEKFYLLDKELEAILADARLEPIEGNSLEDSFGLAVLYPDRYGDFRREALAAIGPHIKYNATTGGDGRAAMKNVAPDSYYLFGITKAKNAFAVWSAPVSIAAGENKLNLQPARLNEVSD